MKPSTLRAAELAAPKQQRNWDWRAATNFILGGSGGGLLLCAVLAGLEPAFARAAVALGLLLIGCGLTCVWFEIGRPWRALNVYRHIASSWMTREAVVALAVFASGGLVVLTGAAVFSMLAAVCGAAFLYSQARILAANKGIPSWRHPASVPLMVGTGLAEGAGLAAVVGTVGVSGFGSTAALGLLVLIALRAWFWQRYLTGLVATGAPEASLRVLHQFNASFVLLGHVVPGLAVAAVLAGMPARPLLLVAGALVVASGWMLKYTLVRRAAFTQGLSLERLPVRGKGLPGAAIKPGWKIMPGTNRP
jgi:phenylacetyl-CoA:acceptor oxidoreductase subunit 2